MAKSRSVARVAARERRSSDNLTTDSFSNFLAKVGVNTANQSSAGTYTFNPVTRLRQLLDYAYRGSWIVGIAVDSVADDMTRAGIDLGSELAPDDGDKLHRQLVRHQIWARLNDTIKNSRLYGGSIAVLLIEKQDVSTPLRIETIAEGSFKGLLVLDRWMINPSLSDLITDMGPDMGLPKYYQVTVDAPALARSRIHHSRVLRFEGDYLPYWQKISENLWGMSVVERLYDRLLAFDSTSQGAAQLAYKAHLRTMSVPNLRKILSMGGQPGTDSPVNGLLSNIQMIRQLQTNEGLTLIDGGDGDKNPGDKFETHQYSFTGLSELILQFGQQLSGALQVPLVRLFGQSPAGLNSTGESDLRNYYDGIQNKQELHLRLPLERVLQVEAKSLGIVLPPSFWFGFRPLWQLRDEQKAEVAKSVTETAISAFESGVVSAAIALKELRQSSRATGIWTNITDEDIADAERDPPVPAPVEISPRGEQRQPSGSEVEQDEPEAVRKPSPITAAGNLVENVKPIIRAVPSAGRVVAGNDPAEKVISAGARHAATVGRISKAVGRIMMDDDVPEC